MAAEEMVVVGRLDREFISVDCMSTGCKRSVVWCRIDLRTGTVVALIVEKRRFFEATGSFEGR